MSFPQRTATCCYVLKRLIRSTGADDQKAVALAASYMLCILSAVPGLDAMEVLDILKRDLAVGSQQKGKEDSLAAVGQLVTALCILQTPQFAEASPKLVSAVYQILAANLKGREYLVSLCVDILVESFKKVGSIIFAYLIIYELICKFFSYPFPCSRSTFGPCCGHNWTSH